MISSGESLSIAIIGFGSAGQRAFSELRKLRPGAGFLVVTRQGQSEKDVRFTQDVRDVEEFRPHAFVLAGPASHRVEILKALKGLNVPVFIEKPMAMTLKNGRTTIDLLGDRTGITQLGYNLRFSKSLRAFRDVILAERFGRVLRFSAETGQFLPDWRPGKDYREGVSARLDLGGGVLLELSHEIDYLRWIFGEWSWVSAWFGQVSSLEIDVEDTALITIGIENGADSTPLSGQLTLDFVRRDKTRTISAICEEGTVRWDGVRGIVEVFDATKMSWTTLVADEKSDSTYENQWKSFLSVVEEGEKPLVGVEDGIEVLRIVEGIRQSHQNSGQRVFLSDVKAKS